MRFIFLAFYIILGTFSSFAQREGTIRNKETAKSDSLAAWYEKTLQLGGIKTIHYCNLGIRQQLMKKGLTFSALVTDVFNTRRWDISSDNPVYSLVNNSKNRSRIFWLGVSWNFHSYKPVGGTKKQEEDRSILG